MGGIDDEDDGEEETVAALERASKAASNPRPPMIYLRTPSPAIAPCTGPTATPTFNWNRAVFRFIKRLAAFSWSAANSNTVSSCLATGDAFLLVSGCLVVV